MPRNAQLAAMLIAAALLGGCQSQQARVAATSNSAHDAEMLGQIASLAGDWQSPDEDGTTTFAVTSAGSAVREIMFPGQPHEMTNVYHMDGPRLVITHYCASGNQPRMVASRPEHTSEGTQYHFVFDSVTNLRSRDEHFMGDMTLALLDDGTIREEWRAYDRAGKLGEPVVFRLSRAPAQ
ncbi:MAG: hypothetical protein IPJ41_08045 [Phycisphaerales bacterium]|nr:hypothetical protein [Phycisphaerales bacterium]